MATKGPPKNTYISKTKSVTSKFNGRKVISRLRQNSQQSYLFGVDSQPPSQLENFKVALYPLQTNVLNFAERFILAFPAIKLGVTEPRFVSEIRVLKTKYRLFLDGCFVVIVTYYVTLITASC